MPPSLWHCTQLEASPWSWQAAQLWMSLRAESPWKAPDPGSAQPGGCGLRALGAPKATCSCWWQVSHELVEWQRWHDAGSALDSTEWRPSQSLRWMKRRSGRSMSFVSTLTISVLAWQSRQKFWSWQVAHDLTSLRATEAWRLKKSPSCDTWVTGRRAYPARSLWQGLQRAAADCSPFLWHFLQAPWAAPVGSRRPGC